MFADTLVIVRGGKLDIFFLYGLVGLTGGTFCPMFYRFVTNNSVGYDYIYLFVYIIV